MYKQTILHKLQLSVLPELNDGRRQLMQGQTLKASAVLVPIFSFNDQLCIVLTQRQGFLRHHANQISFPGGKKDPTDKTLADTALRETFEEIGVDINAVSIINKLSEIQTPSGFSITPYTGFIAEHAQFKLNYQEVRHLVYLPLEVLLQQTDWACYSVKIKNRYHQVYAFQYNEHFIWGATAAILKQLSMILK
ncbi:CoA pyrophosphatase [Catenovulum sediminis]|uniref:CoA pyrophosphatase n=1 Tax=Catenovulum sediminis TaxID=1740262 RepID=A0ABV1RIU3_9ALTE|nr:CoA pyrophosphatase [Catenovulum sediminis]